MKSTIPLNKGERVIIREKSHPWAGHAGEYQEHKSTLVGKLAVVKLDNSISCMVKDSGFERAIK